MTLEDTRADAIRMLEEWVTVLEREAEKIEVRPDAPAAVLDIARTFRALAKSHRDALARIRQH